MKFKEDCPFPTPEAAERKLLELANAVEPDHPGRLLVETINRQFRDAGGSYEEYGGGQSRHHARLDHCASVRCLLVVHAGRGGPVRAAGLRNLTAAIIVAI